MPDTRLSPAQNLALFSFRGTGRYVGKDARLKCRRPKKGIRHVTMMALYRKKLVDHWCANQWLLTDAGRDFIRNGGTL